MDGESIAHYSISTKIGEGEMGAVYRATDTRLNREVAVKVLPEAFAEDSERMARFQREAQLLAALNHPRIAAIHGLEEEKGRRILVMELVEGEDLSQILARRQLALEEALKIALQIAEGVESAHEKGIVHRDLKPANIKITPNGEVKILDFGLAKVLESEMSSSPDLSRSPTLTHAGTDHGIIIGTAGYMSPEQARGQATDRRADIWAFGAILFEMLCGRRAFAGQTVSDTLARVLEREPEWESLPKNTPQPMRNLVERCMEKNVGRRLQAIGEARIVLQDFLDGSLSAEGKRIAPTDSAPSRSGRRLPWALAGLATALAALVTVGWWQASRSPNQPPVRLNARISDEPLFSDLGAATVLSPDGTRIAYSVGVGELRLYTRSLDRLDGTLLSGTEGGYNPFFSFDGQWIGFFTPGQLKKVPVTGGTPLVLGDVNLNRGGSWGPDDAIVFAPNPGSGLYRIPAAGGEPEELTTLAEGEVTHRWPQVLPNGKGVLFTSHSRAGGFDDATVEALDLETGERRVLHKGGSYGRYVSSGHLLFAQEGSVFAVRFDPERLETTGSPVPVLQEVRSNTATHGSSQFATSDNGTLAYVTGTGGLPEYHMVFVDREGRSELAVDDRRTFGEPRFSPDGNFLAVEIIDGTNRDAWVYDLRRGVPTRLTFEESGDDAPVWSPDAEHLAFSSNRLGSTLNIYRKRSDGSGDVERLTESTSTQFISSWSPDGKHLLFAQSNPETGNDLYVLPLEDGTPEVFLTTPFSETEAAFSPDGRWIAYQSNETGQAEIFVRPFPVRGGKWQLSVDGGQYPRWSRNGRELFYRSGEGMYVVPVDIAGSSFVAGKPRLLFEGPFLSLSLAGLTLADYDVHPDGERFVMMQADPEASIRSPSFFGKPSRR